MLEDIKNTFSGSWLSKIKICISTFVDALNPLNNISSSIGDQWQGDKYNYFSGTIFPSLSNAFSQTKTSMEDFQKALDGLYSDLEGVLSPLISEMDRQSQKCDDIAEWLQNYLDAHRNIESNGISKIINSASILSVGIGAVATGFSNSDNTSSSYGWSGSFLSGSTERNVNLGNINISSQMEGELIGGSLGSTAGFEWDKEKGNIGLSAGINAEGHLAKGSVSMSSGLMNGKVQGSVGNISAKGDVGISLFKDGEFSPKVEAGVSAKASVAEGSVEGSFGNDDYNAHVQAKGSFLSAEAKAEVGAGIITYEDSTGATKSSIGVKGEVGAEAYFAEGTVSGGVTICGIKFDVGLTGKAGGAGIKAGGYATADNVGFDVGFGIGVGAGLSFDVDFSGFKNPIDDIGDKIENIGNSVANAIESISNSNVMPWNWF